MQLAVRQATTHYSPASSCSDTGTTFGQSPRYDEIPHAALVPVRVPKQTDKSPFARDREVAGRDLRAVDEQRHPVSGKHHPHLIPFSGLQRKGRGFRQVELVVGGQPRALVLRVGAPVQLGPLRLEEQHGPADTGLISISSGT